jgi:hypothetical protein
MDKNSAIDLSGLDLSDLKMDFAQFGLTSGGGLVGSNQEIFKDDNASRVARDGLKVANSMLSETSRTQSRVTGRELTKDNKYSGTVAPRSSMKTQSSTSRLLRQSAPSTNVGGIEATDTTSRVTLSSSARVSDRTGGIEVTDTTSRVTLSSSARVSDRTGGIEATDTTSRVTLSSSARVSDRTQDKVPASSLRQPPPESLQSSGSGPKQASTATAHRSLDASTMAPAPSKTFGTNYSSRLASDNGGSLPSLLPVKRAPEDADLVDLYFGTKGTISSST